ncbi:MAG: hypothetical protein JWL85_875 [Candidatus Saccharibacteria bacterium]|nr:hypothetical protein [Candidatus Saccharibacteria bacterium]
MSFTMGFSFHIRDEYDYHYKGHHSSLLQAFYLLRHVAPTLNRGRLPVSCRISLSMYVRRMILKS